MEYSKLQLSFVRSALWRDASRAAQGVWVNVVTYCADQENGGTIPHCSTWNDAKCLLTMGVSCAELNALVESNLAEWRDGDLIVRGYDATGEKAFQRKSATGAERANVRWSKTPNVGGDRLRAKLSECAMATDSTALQEWRVYLRDTVGATSFDEAAAFLDWCYGLARRDSIPMRYARHAGDAAAREWRERFQPNYRKDNP